MLISLISINFELKEAFNILIDPDSFYRNAPNVKPQLKKMAVAIIWSAKIHIVKLNSAGFVLDNGNLTELRGKCALFTFTINSVVS